jgi:hypothetical protein
VIEKLTAKLGEEVTSPYESGSWSAKVTLVGETVNDEMVAAYRGLSARNGNKTKNKTKKRIFFMRKNPIWFSHDYITAFKKLQIKKDRLHSCRCNLSF